jgi:type IV pilus assembly protein PilV
MKPSYPSPRGATLIEAMAALVVFSIGILGVMQMNVLASHQNNVARSHTIASKIARDVADSFERLPFNHPLLLANSSLDPATGDFIDIDNPDGRTTLADAIENNQGRPILGASSAIYASDASFRDKTGKYIPFYEVAWRTKRLTNPERAGAEDQIRIVVMVRYNTPGGANVVTAWAVKYDMVALTGDDRTLQEL